MSLELLEVESHRLPKKERVLTIRARRRGVSVVCSVESAVADPDNRPRLLSLSGAARSSLCASSHAPPARPPAPRQ